MCVYIFPAQNCTLISQAYQEAIASWSSLRAIIDSCVCISSKIIIIFLKSIVRNARAAILCIGLLIQGRF